MHPECWIHEDAQPVAAGNIYSRRIHTGMDRAMKALKDSTMSIPIRKESLCSLGCIHHMIEMEFPHYKRTGKLKHMHTVGRMVQCSGSPRLGQAVEGPALSSSLTGI